MDSSLIYDPMRFMPDVFPDELGRWRVYDAEGCGICARAETQHSAETIAVLLNIKAELEKGCRADVYDIKTGRRIPDELLGTRNARQLGCN
jgi:hypothetical protein